MADNKQRDDNKDAQESGQPVQLDKEPQQGGQHGAEQDEGTKPGGAQQKPGGARPGGGQAGQKQ
jgi:hypothetical protein